ncbi:hypothetical protein V8C42DRAFT_139395 [Trichoderma barbatum]
MVGGRDKGVVGMTFWLERDCLACCVGRDKVEGRLVSGREKQISRGSRCRKSSSPLLSTNSQYPASALCFKICRDIDTKTIDIRFVTNAPQISNRQCWTLGSATLFGQQTGDSFWGPQPTRFHTPVRYMQGFCCPFRQWARADGGETPTCSQGFILALSIADPRHSAASRWLAVKQQFCLALHADPSWAAQRGFRVPCGWLLAVKEAVRNA